MRRLAYLYDDEKSFYTYLNDENFKLTQNCFVRIFTSELEELEAISVAKSIKEILPNSILVGATSANSIIFKGQQLQNKTMVLIDTYQHLTIKTAYFNYEDKSPNELAKEVHKEYASIASNGNVAINTIFSDNYSEIESFLTSVNEMTPVLKFIGGIAGGKENCGMGGFLFDEKDTYKNKLLTFAAYGNEANNFIKLTSGLEVISPEYTVTEMNDLVINKIENVPAIDWILSNLGFSAEDIPCTIKSYPQDEILDHFLNVALLSTEENCGSRYISFNPKNKDVSLYYAKLEELHKFRLGIFRQKRATEENYNICVEMLDSAVEYLFVYTCLLKTLLWKNYLEWELTPFAKLGVCGICMIGEIVFQNGKNCYFNGTTAFSGIAEKEKYLIPDALNLEVIPIAEGDEEIYLNAINTQKEIAKTRHIPVESFESTQTHDFDNSFTDKETGLPNLYKYKIDKEKFKYTKMLVTEVQNADISIAFAGMDQYIKGITDVLAPIVQMLPQVHPALKYPLYTFNYKTFAIPATEEITNDEFVAICQKMHEGFGSAVSDSTGLVGVSRFLIMLNRDDMLEFAMSALLDTKNSQENFLVFDQKISGNTTAGDEVKAIELLNNAINSDWVVPYYQAIYNNENNEIEKYEALMRLIDDNGKLYTPFAFMDVAKKYNFYGRLSSSMIKKVLDDFSDIDASVSINISSYDIMSSTFRTWLLNALSVYPNPERVTVEFVETEDFKEIAVLYEFVEALHSMGAKIALDDFGSGYATFSTIVKLKPDYLKIDGSIIKNIVSGGSEQIILDTINFLALKLGTKTIAEFVENEEIQEMLKIKKIDYSQGYYFSKPVPIEEVRKNHNK